MYDEGRVIRLPINIIKVHKQLIITDLLYCPQHEPVQQHPPNVTVTLVEVILGFIPFSHCLCAATHAQ